MLIGFYRTNPKAKAGVVGQVVWNRLSATGAMKVDCKVSRFVSQGQDDLTTRCFGKELESLTEIGCDTRRTSLS